MVLDWPAYDSIEPRLGGSPKFTIMLSILRKARLKDKEMRILML